MAVSGKVYSKSDFSVGILQKMVQHSLLQVQQMVLINYFQ